MPSRRRMTPDPLALEGEVWLMIGDKELGGQSRMGLLGAVAEQGSITQAAKAVGLSYKAAWDAIDRMNAIAGVPLVERSIGGHGGGSTRLTERGARLLERFRQIDAVHRRFVSLLGQATVDLGKDFSLLEVLNLKTSARNQFVGTVSALRSGAVNDEIELTLPGGTRLVAIVTRESAQSLGLRTHLQAIALVKASSVLLATGLDGAKVSARNQLHGTVASVTPGAVNAEVVLDTEDGVSVAAIVTQASVHSLGLAPGVQATAFFKASSVILAVTN
jgi:molybdate transport system regulatory protein